VSLPQPIASAAPATPMAASASRSHALEGESSVCHFLQREAPEPEMQPQQLANPRLVLDDERPQSRG
jgi:hypothetical protein